MSALPDTLKNRPSPHLIRALLPWEAEADFIALLESWRTAYDPQGPAEKALVEQLVWIDWRRKRIVLGERALHLSQLHSRTGTGSSYGTSDPLVKRALIAQPSRTRKYNSREAVATQAEDDVSLGEFADEALQRALQAQTILEADRADALTEAAGFLEADSLDWWRDEREDAPERFAETAAGLLNFIKAKLVPWLEGLAKEAQERDAVRLQAHGESLDPNRMGILLALDERLGRQFEKALGMLIKLQEMRGTSLNSRE